ncbi:uncharacterized protein LOC128959921 [Oppia nitens]|uniref:uncharacterized protein LOC128959921 n=1 Tax=Oppia nitens TaxID=1686743 RepID=UPI0023DCDACF|nr:uncharacterized protein LOC128959921 [Oppia nitens]
MFRLKLITNKINTTKLLGLVSVPILTTTLIVNKCYENQTFQSRLRSHFGLRCAFNDKQITEVYDKINCVVKVKGFDCGIKTGVIVDNQLNLILTAYHTVLDCFQCPIELLDKYNESDLINHANAGNNQISSLAADVVYTDPNLDLAILKLNGIKSNVLKNVTIVDQNLQQGSPIIMIYTENVKKSFCKGVLSTPSMTECFSEDHQRHFKTFADNKRKNMQLWTNGSKDFFEGPVFNIESKMIGFANRYIEDHHQLAVNSKDVNEFIRRAKEHIQRGIPEVQQRRSFGITLKDKTVVNVLTQNPQGFLAKDEIVSIGGDTDVVKKLKESIKNGNEVIAEVTREGQKVQLKVTPQHQTHWTSNI